MFEKIPKYSLIPLSHCMDDANTQGHMTISDAGLPFSLEYEELFLFISRVLYSMRIIHIVLPSSYEEEIECTIDREGKYESCREDSEDRDRYISEELPEYARKRHHGDEYDDRRHDS